jgi:hypothetical protein
LRFLRGSAQLYYADLASGALQLPPALLSRVPPTAVMGDCHVSNFGFLTGERLAQYARPCGEGARAHARGDRRSTRFEAAVAGILADEADALLDAAGGYAARVIADWRLLQAMLPS